MYKRRKDGMCAGCDGARPVEPPLKYCRPCTNAKVRASAKKARDARRAIREGAKLVARRCPPLP